MTLFSELEQVLTTSFSVLMCVWISLLEVYDCTTSSFAVVWDSVTSVLSTSSRLVFEVMAGRRETSKVAKEGFSASSPSAFEGEPDAPALRPCCVSPDLWILTHMCTSVVIMRLVSDTLMSLLMMSVWTVWRTVPGAELKPQRGFLCSAWLLSDSLSLSPAPTFCPASCWAASPLQGLGTGLVVTG